LLLYFLKLLDRKRPTEFEAPTLGSVPKRARTIKTAASGQVSSQAPC